MFVLHWLFLFVVTFDIALSNLVFKKEDFILKEEIPTINCFKLCVILLHDDDPRAQMLGRCQVTINIHFCQFFRKNFSESGASISEILCQ